MKLILDHISGRLYQGFAQDILDVVEPESVDCIITSPPYFGLRNYSDETIQIFGGDKNCSHKWKSYNGRWDKKNQLQKNSPNEQCINCQAFRTQLGLEPTVEMFVLHLTEIFEKVLKVLKPAGTCFINMGDTYLDDGNLGLVADRLALSLMMKGFYLRNKIVWNKRVAFYTEDGWETTGNGMPESVDNRFSKSTEIIIFITKQKTGYYFDVNALKLGWKEESIARLTRGISETHKYSKLFLYGGGGGLNKPRNHIKKYKGKLKPVAEQISSMRARENRICDKINTGAISATTGSIFWNSFYRAYEKDIQNPEVQFVIWLRREIQNAGIEKKLDELFGIYLWRNWIRQDRPGVVIPSIEQWNVTKKLLGYNETPFDWLIVKHGFKRPPDSIFMNTQPRPESHFATFPDLLVEILIKHGCPEGGIVLDPFAGICNAAIVAHNLQRRWICIEPVSDFIKIAERKIRNEASQQFLFMRR